MSNIKLIIFDLDGVLVDARELHYETLNKALIECHGFKISREDHLSKYDGLNTKAKLSILSKETDLPKSAHQDIFDAKQRYTLESINEMQTDTPKRLLLRKLKDEGYTIAVASNSIRQTLKMMLVKRGLIEFVDFFYSNEDVSKPKPSTEIYLKCMIKAGVSPKETLIIEDSQHGRKAAIATGAYLMGVKNATDVTYDNIKSMLGNIQTHFTKGEKWQDKNMNVLIPMSGLGSRFAKAGYTFPKPLIEVNQKPMIQMVIENLNIEAHYIFIIQKEHYERYNLRTLLSLLAPSFDVVLVDHLTEGAACSTLLASRLIDNDKPLLIVNSDQYLVWDSFDFMYSMVGDSTDGGIVTFSGSHPKWSFAAVGDDGIITKVAEKDPISNHANTGVYFWSKGSDYVKYANQMIQAKDKTNGEYYVAPSFNYAIRDGKRIKNYHIDEFYGTGTPEDLDYFLKHYKPQ